MERDTVEFRQTLGITVVADDQRDVAGQFATLVPMQEIGQAMVVLRDHDGHACTLLWEIELPLHLQTLGDRAEVLAERIGFNSRATQVPLHAHEKQVVLRILMLVGIAIIGVMPIKEIRDRSDDAFLVWAGNQQGGRVFHGVSNPQSSVEYWKNAIISTKSASPEQVQASALYVILQPARCFFAASTL